MAAVQRGRFPDSIRKVLDGLSSKKTGAKKAVGTKKTTSTTTGKIKANPKTTKKTKQTKKGMSHVDKSRRNSADRKRQQQQVETFAKDYSTGYVISSSINASGQRRQSVMHFDTRKAQPGSGRPIGELVIAQPGAPEPLRVAVTHDNLRSAFTRMRAQELAELEEKERFNPVTLNTHTTTNGSRVFYFNNNPYHQQHAAVQPQRHQVMYAVQPLDHDPSMSSRRGDIAMLVRMLAHP
jgi:hypothetical protein